MAYAQAERVERPENRGRRKISEITIKPAENGGHVITHQYSSPMDMGYHKPTMHVFGPEDGPEAMAHIAKHAKINIGGAQEPEAE